MKVPVEVATLTQHVLFIVASCDVLPMITCIRPHIDMLISGIRLIVTNLNIIKTIYAIRLAFRNIWRHPGRSIILKFLKWPRNNGLYLFIVCYDPSTNPWTFCSFFFNIWCLRRILWLIALFGPFYPVFRQYF